MISSIALNSVQVCTCQYKVFRGMIFMGHSVLSSGRNEADRDEGTRRRGDRSKDTAVSGVLWSRT